MKPATCVPLEPAPAPLIAPGERIADILVGLAARMSAEQRHAFVAKMSSLDRQLAGTTLSVTQGSA